MTAKPGFKAVLLLITGLATGAASAQTIQSVEKFLTEPILESVVLKKLNGQIKPAYFIYSNRIVSTTAGRQQSLKVLNMYLNRSQTQFVLIKAPDYVSKSRTSQLLVDWTKMPVYFLPDQGDYAGYCRVTGLKLNFFNPQRQLVREYQIPQPANYINLPPLGAFDRRGKHMVLYKPETRLDKKKGIPNLFYFLGTGTRLWETQLPIEKVKAVGIANQTQLIIISGQLPKDSVVNDPRVTLVLDSTAQIVASYPIIFDNYHFSEDDNYLALSDGYYLWLIYLPNKTPRFINPVCTDNRVITDCRFIGNYLLVATGSKSYLNEQLIYNDPTLMVFDLAGYKIAEATFPLDYSVKGKLIVDTQSRQFGFVFQDRLEVFRLDAPRSE